MGDTALPTSRICVEAAGVPHQFAVQLDNRPGELAHLARALGARGINISHIWCAGAGATVGVFLTTTENEATRHVLRCLGHEFIEGQTIVIDVPDQPGGLADAAERLAAAGVNIQGTLCIGKRSGVIEMAFAVDDETKALAALAAAPLAGVH
jgi:hypothetical protein